MFWLFVVLVVSRFGFEGGIWFLIASVPGQYILVTSVPGLNCSKLTTSLVNISLKFQT